MSFSWQKFHPIVLSLSTFILERILLIFCHIFQYRYHFDQLSDLDRRHPTLIVICNCWTTFPLVFFQQILLLSLSSHFSSHVSMNNFVEKMHSFQPFWIADSFSSFDFSSITFFSVKIILIILSKFFDVSPLFKDKILQNPWKASLQTSLNQFLGLDFISSIILGLDQAPPSDFLTYKVCCFFVFSQQLTAQLKMSLLPTQPTEGPRKHLKNFLIFSTCF